MSVNHRLSETFADRMYPFFFAIAKDPEVTEVFEGRVALIADVLIGAMRSGVLPEDFPTAQKVANMAFLIAKRRIVQEFEHPPTDELFGKTKTEATRLWIREYDVVLSDLSDPDHLEGRLEEITRMLAHLASGTDLAGKNLAEAVRREADDLRYRLLREEYAGHPRQRLEGRLYVLDILWNSLRQDRPEPRAPTVRRVLD